MKKPIKPKLTKEATERMLFEIYLLAEDFIARKRNHQFGNSLSELLQGYGFSLHHLFQKGNERNWDEMQHNSKRKYADRLFGLMIRLCPGYPDHTLNFVKRLQSISLSNMIGIPCAHDAMVMGLSCEMMWLRWGSHVPALR